MNKKEREATLARLERWLRRPVWSFREAAPVLTGVLSEGPDPTVASMLNAPRGFRGLGGSALAQALEERESYLRHRWQSLDLSPQPPGVWLKRAVDIGEEPGWLGIAQRTEHLRQLLSEELQAGGKASDAQTKTELTIAEKGGLGRNKGTFADLVRRKVREEWETRGMAGRESHEVREFLKTMIEEFVDPEAPHGQNKPNTAKEAKHPKVRTEGPIRDEVRRLSAG